MKWLSLVVATAACITGFIAARLWRKSINVQIDPLYPPSRVGAPSGPSGEASQALAWSVATIQAFKAVADLNRQAALWTAASVTLSALAAFYTAVLA